MFDGGDHLVHVVGAGRDGLRAQVDVASHRPARGTILQLSILCLILFGLPSLGVNPQANGLWF